MTIKNNIDPFNYDGGSIVLDRINLLINSKGRIGISETYGVNSGTISTWKKRKQTPFELAVRINISEGVSLKWLLLGKGDMYEKTTVEKKHDLFDQFHLENGNLTGIEALELNHKNIIQHFNISASNTIAIQTEKTTYLIDKSANNITSGKYLIKMDSTHLVTTLTRLPNSKALIDLYGREVEINNEYINIEGKVIFQLIRN